MATLSAGDLTNERSKKHKSTPYLSVYVPDVLVTGTLVASGGRGVRSLHYDTGTGTGFADVLPNQTIEVDTVYGTEILRLKSITGSQAAADFEVGEHGAVLTDGDVVRFKRLHELHAIPPTIRNGVVYVDYDIPYIDQNTFPPPVARAGFFVKVGWVPYSFSILRSYSYAVADGATIASISVTAFPSTGVTITPNGVNVDITITTAGSRILRIRTIDSNGRGQDTYRVVFGHDAANPPYTGFSVSPPGASWDSRGYSFSLLPNGSQSVNLAQFPNGSLVVLWYDNTFDDVAGYVDLWGTNNQNIICAGYLRNNDSERNDLRTGVTQVDFQVETPEALFANITELGSVSVNSTNGTVDKWYLYEEWLTVGRAIDYLLSHHTTAKQVFELVGITDNTIGLKSAEFTESNLEQQINNLADEHGYLARMVSSRFGVLHLCPDSQMLVPIAARDALDTVFTITIDDIDGSITVVHAGETVVASAEANGFFYDGATSVGIISVIPGYRVDGVTYLLPKFRGTGNKSVGPLVLTDQTQCDEIVGQVFAYENRDIREIRFKTPRNYLGAFDIVRSIGWYEWGIADNQLSRALGILGRQFVVSDIRNIIDDEAGVISTEVVLEPRVDGVPGLPANYPVSYPPPPTGTVSRPPGADEPDDPAMYILGWIDGASSDAFTIIPFVLEAGTFAAGSATVMDSSDSILMAMSPLSSTTMAVMWAQATGDIYLALVTRVVSLLSVGALVNPGATHIAVPGIDVAGMTETLMIITYLKAGGFNDLVARTVSVSGSTLTLNAESAVINNNNVRFPCMCRLTDTTAFLCYVEDPGDTQSWVNIHLLTTSGTSLTVDVGNTIFTGDASTFMQQYKPSMVRLTDTLAVLIMPRAIPAASDIAAIAVLNNAGSISNGTLVVLSEADTSTSDGRGAYKMGSRLTDTDFVVVWRNASNDLRSVICTVDPVTLAITVNTPITLIATLPTSQVYPAVISTADRAIYVYNDASPVKAVSAEWSGVTLTDDGNELTIASNGSNEIKGISQFEDLL